VARLAFEDLEWESRYLVSKNEYRHGVLYRNDEVLHALDAFAARAGRRR